MYKPKIAIIHPSIGDSSGGSQIFVLELAEKLKDRCDITIFSYKKVNELCKPIFSIPRGEVAKTKNPLLKWSVKFLRNFVTAPEVVIEHLTVLFPSLFELLKGDYDIIFPNNDWGGLLVASIARKIKKTPVIFTEHSGFMFEGLIAKRNIKFNPDKYIALSIDFMEWVKVNYPDCDVEYIPNGVDLVKFNPNRVSVNMDLPGPVILTVARHQPNKRIDLVIEAVAKLNEGSLLLISSGENVESLRQKGEKLIGKDRFKLTRVPFEEMPSYYNSCDVFTLPSEHEPFGLVYLEAMACNKPVVAPNDASRREIIGDAGILCDVTNIDEYAQALKEVIETDFGEKALNQAGKYSWEACSNRYYRVIKSLIGDIN